MLVVLRENGIAGISARSIAQRAGVNQALVFYHYGSVTQLLDSAARASVEAVIEVYGAQFEDVATFSQLLAVGRKLHDRERVAGNVAVMAQLTAGAQNDTALAATARQCFNRWANSLEPTVYRLLHGSPLNGLIDAPGLTRAVAAAFIGLELYDGVDRAAAEAALNSIGQLGAILEAVDSLGAVATRAIRIRLRHRGPPRESNL